MKAVNSLTNKPLELKRISYSGAMPLDTCELKPGQYVEIPLRDLVLGGGTFQDPVPDILMITFGVRIRFDGKINISTIHIGDGKKADNVWLAAGPLVFHVYKKRTFLPTNKSPN